MKKKLSSTSADRNKKWHLQSWWLYIGKTCCRGHTLTLHCTIPPPTGLPSRIDGPMWQQQMPFLATLLIMVIEIQFNFQIYVLFAEKKNISKITFNIQWNLKQIWHSWQPKYQKATSKGSRTMGSEWPDKRDKTGFGSVTRGWEEIFRVVLLLWLTAWALGWFE